MEGRLLLRDCTLFATDGRLRTRMAVVVEGGTITRVGPADQLPSLPGDWEVRCRERLVMPGWVDFHSHLVSSQLASPLADPRARALLDRMEALLSAGEVEALTAFAIGRALRAGVTMLAEHLRCPNCVAAGLTAQANLGQRMGARLVLSHGTGDAPGATRAVEQLEQNADWARSRGKKFLDRPALGLRSVPCDDDPLLEKIGRLREELAVDVHYHSGEEPVRGGNRPSLARLETLGLTGPNAYVALGPEAGPSAVEALARTRTGMALSFFPPSLARALSAAQKLATGAQSMGLCTAWGDSWPQALSFAWGQLAEADGAISPERESFLSRVLFTEPAKFRSRCYGGLPSQLEEGALADLVIYDLVPAHASLGAALIWQLGKSPVAWTIVAGRVVVREGKLLCCDFLELAREAAAALKAIWSRAALA